jgi:predicted small secreted protein
MRDKTIIIIVLAVLSAVLLSGCNNYVCGNGVIEKDETSLTCCMDVGCPGAQNCMNNSCVDPKCSSCEYLDSQAHKCVKYDCCSSSDCNADEECSDHKCTGLLCKSCTYVDGHKCVAFKCCGDSGCNDNNEMTIDVCKLPSTKSADCSHEAIQTCKTDSDCNDKKALTKDICVKGSISKCVHTNITECEDNDGFCPEGCEYDDDNDCETGIEDCGTSITCFEDALDACEPASLSFDMDVDDDERKQDISISLEILSWDDEEELCNVSFEFDTIDIEYTDDYIEELLNDSNTEDEIDDLLADENDDADDIEGDSGECSLEEGEMTNVKTILSNWKADDFDVDDFNSYDCDGDFFD